MNIKLNPVVLTGFVVCFGLLCLCVWLLPFEEKSAVSKGEVEPIIASTTEPMEINNDLSTSSEVVADASSNIHKEDNYKEKSPEVVPGTNNKDVQKPVPSAPNTTQDSPIEAQSKINLPLKVMAWIYPSAPGCKAASEFSDGRHIDVLKPEFFTIEGGLLQVIDSADAECNGFSASFVSELKKYSREQYVTVSSASADDMDTFFSDQANVKVGISTLVSFVVANKLTGIELDFEDFGGWDADSYSNFIEFVKELGSSLHAEGKKLMVDGPSIADSNEQSWFLWRYEDFVSLPVDTMVIMLYDYQFDHGAGQPVAPLDWMKEVISRTAIYYPKSKLSVGVPSYGYESFSKKRPVIQTYDQLKNKPGFSDATRDERSGEMTWTNGGKVYFYQDAESIRRKIAVVQSLGIESVSIWHLGGNLWF